MLTLWIDSDTQEYFNRLRRRYFPAERNFLEAHLTLFHHLPDQQPIHDSVKRMAGTTNQFPIQEERVVSLGKGTAVNVESTELFALHRRLQAEWYPFLTSQDKQKLWAHITVQNKVSSTCAREVQDLLNRRFAPFRFNTLGLRLWRYIGGPWEALAGIGFNAY